ncbi:MAG: CAP domain-containing protein [Thermoleophilaceae bacterium]
MTRSKGHARWYALAALVALAVFVAAPPSASASCHNKYAHPAQVSNATVKQTTLCLLNKRRHAHGRRALKPNQRLARAARRHARDMVRRNYFSHTAPGGVDFVDRIMRQDYVNPGEGWFLGENLAWGSYQLATPKSIVRSWMHSPGHRANILNPRFREIGIGVVTGSPQSGTQNAATYSTSFGTRY